jgi:hypothetical protein
MKSLRRFPILLSCLAIAFGDVALTTSVAVAQNIGPAMERPKFDEFWRRILPMLQERDGFVEKEDIERALGIDLREINASAVNASTVNTTRYAVADIPGRLRVEWRLYQYTTPAARAAHPGATAMSSVDIYWYEATFEAFDAGVANKLARKDLHEAGFMWRPPKPHTHGGVTPGYFSRRGGLSLRLDVNAKQSDGRYAIHFSGTALAKPAK